MFFFTKQKSTSAKMLSASSVSDIFSNT